MHVLPDHGNRDLPVGLLEPLDDRFPLLEVCRGQSQAELLHHDLVEILCMQ